MRTARLALLLLAACGREPAPPPAAAAPPASAAAPGPPTQPVAQERSGAGPDGGEPDMPGVERLFRSRFAEVKRCYEAALQRDAELRGKLTLAFTIVESGAIGRVSVARSTFRRRDVPACVAEVVRRWQTPFRPAEPVEVEYPFSFSPR